MEGWATSQKPLVRRVPLFTLSTFLLTRKVAVMAGSGMAIWDHVVA